MDRSAFYTSLRRRDSGVFGSSLSQKQVEGTEAMLDECIRVGADLGQAAYILATNYGETGGKMQPQEENLRYSAKRIPQVFSAARRQGKTPKQLAGNPQLLANTVYGGEWGAKNLGNTEPGDGWRYRGMGGGQITGRANYRKWGKNLQVDLLEQPELMMQLSVSVRALAEPMLEGWATGHKLSKFVKGDERDYFGARRTWNGVFDAKKYASYAKAFEAALEAAGYAPQEFVRPDVEPPREVYPELRADPKPEPAPNRRGFLARMFGR